MVSTVGKVALFASSVLLALPASAQTRPATDPIAPLPEAAQPTLAMPVPPPAPPPLWQIGDVEALLSLIPTTAEEGLDPKAYDARGLEAAMRSGDPVAMSAAATERYYRIASDFALGRVKVKDRADWHVVDDKFDEAARRALLDSALAQHNVIGSLKGLLPTHPQYAALKAALTKPGQDARTLGTIKLNLDRWRWLPRDLGTKYVIVNVPSFYATLVENGAVRWKHRAIAGAVKTKTPQLNAMATGVILNPWWEVPPSISGEVAGKKGFVKSANGKGWRQPPGPTNALGQLKFVMYNPQNIYLHDTNARSRFDSRMRALSHGCIRTQHVVDLAKELLADDNGPWTPEKVDETLASGKSVMAKFVKPVPVYIVYFSAAALNDGSIVNYQDLYGRDAGALAALSGAPLPKAPAKKPTQTASR